MRAVPSVKVTWPHAHSPAEARDALESVLRELGRQLGGSYAWEGDSLRFNASGASGRCLLREQEVVVEVQLGIALWPLKGRVEREIRERLRASLG